MDWKARLARAEKAGYFTNLDLRLAGQWASCALGERSAQLIGERLSDDLPGIPDFITLEALEFVGAVELDAMSDARAAYDAIQAWDGGA